MSRTIFGVFVLVFAFGVFFNFGHVETAGGNTITKFFSIATLAEDDYGCCDDDAGDTGDTMDDGGGDYGCCEDDVVSIDDDGGDYGCCDDGGGIDDTPEDDPVDEPYVPVLPICTLTATPGTIDHGSYAKLNWSSQHADSGSINKGVGALLLITSPNASGYKNVSPTETTTYTATFTNEDGSVTCNTTVVVKPIPKVPVCTLTAPSGYVYKGDAATLTWTSSNVTSGTIDNGVGAISPVAGGSKTVYPTATTYYTAKFTGPHGNVECMAEIKVKVKAAPICTLTPASQYINKGDSAKLTWTSSNATTGVMDEGVGSLTPVAGSFVNVSPTETTSYKATFTGPGGVVDCHAEVKVKTPPPPPGKCVMEINKSVNKTSVVAGDYVEYTIEFKNIGTKDCTGGGVKVVDVVDSRLTYLSETHSSEVTAGYGSDSVYKASDKTLRWNANTLVPGESGWVKWKAKVGTPTACSETIPNTAKITSYEYNNFTEWVTSNTVKSTLTKDCTPPKAPVCTLTPASQYINKGDSAKLTWTSSNATTGVMDEGVGSLTPVAGSFVNVSPTETTSYKATFTGPGGVVDCNAEVKVKTPPPPTPKTPVCTLEAADTYINKGDSTKLKWTSSNVTSGSIDNGVGSASPVALGEKNVSPTATTYYTAKFTGPHGDVECSAKVKVKTPPPPPNSPVCTLTPETQTITKGDSAKLTWTSSNATTGVMDEGVGSLTPVAGSFVNVSPTETTSYKATFTGSGGVVDCHATVKVTSTPTPTVPVCTMTINPGQISRGAKATLAWTGTNVTSLTIDSGIGATTTVNGSIEVGPEDNKTYTGVFSGPHGNVTCQASITVTTGGGGCSGNCGRGQQPPKVVLYQKPVNQPLAAVYLSQIPYTGFDAGPITTAVYWTLLVIWSALVAYFLVYRGYWAKILPASGPALPKTKKRPSQTIEEDLDADEAEESVVVASTMTLPSYSSLPFNLPMATNVEPIIETESVLEPVTGLERAVEKRLGDDKILISKYGMERLASSALDETSLMALLEKVAYAARRNYPREDGWIALSDARVEETLANVLPAVQAMTTPKVAGAVEQTVVSVPAVPAVAPVTTGAPTAFVAAIIAGEKDKVFATLRDAAQNGKGVDALMMEAVLLLDRVYRARMENAGGADESLKAMTASIGTKELEELVRILSAAIDETYSSSLTAAKLALANALSFTATFKK